MSNFFLGQHSSRHEHGIPPYAQISQITSSTAPAITQGAFHKPNAQLVAQSRVTFRQNTLKVQMLWLPDGLCTYLPSPALLMEPVHIASISCLIDGTKTNWAKNEKLLKSIIKSQSCTLVAFQALMSTIKASLCSTFLENVYQCTIQGYIYYTCSQPLFVIHNILIGYLLILM